MEGGSPSPARGQGRPDLHRAGAGAPARAGPHAAPRTGVCPRVSTRTDAASARAPLSPPRPPLPPASPSGPSRSALSAGLAPPGLGRATRGPTPARLRCGVAGPAAETPGDPSGDWRAASGRPGRTDPAALQARLPWASSGPGHRDAAGSFVLEPRRGRRRRHSAWSPGKEGSRGDPGPVAPRGLTSPSSCTGRSSTERSRHPAARPGARPAVGVQGPGRGAAATAAPRAPQPPAPRPACSGSGSAAGPASALPGRPSSGAAAGRAPSPGGSRRAPPAHPARPPAHPGQSRGLRAGGAAAAAGAAHRRRRASEVCESAAGSRLSCGAAPARSPRPARSDPAPPRPAHAGRPAPRARTPSRPQRPSALGWAPRHRCLRRVPGVGQAGTPGEEGSARGTGRRVRKVASRAGGAGQQRVPGPDERGRGEA